MAGWEKGEVPETYPFAAWRDGDAWFRRRTCLSVAEGVQATAAANAANRSPDRGVESFHVTAIGRSP